jgi:hypothetical protein
VFEDWTDDAALLPIKLARVRCKWPNLSLPVVEGQADDVSVPPLHARFSNSVTPVEEVTAAVQVPCLSSHLHIWTAGFRWVFFLGILHVVGFEFSRSDFRVAGLRPSALSTNFRHKSDELGLGLGLKGESVSIPGLVSGFRFWDWDWD